MKRCSVVHAEGGEPCGGALRIQCEKCGSHQSLEGNTTETSRVNIQAGKHSPGPWKATDQGEGPRGKSLGICISDSRGLPMFFLPRGKAEHQANARLIASAPRQNEALVKAEKFIALILNNYKFETTVAIGGMLVLDSIRSAILQATGASPEATGAEK